MSAERESVTHYVTSFCRGGAVLRCSPGRLPPGDHFTSNSEAVTCPECADCLAAEAAARISDDPEATYWAWFFGNSK